MRAWFSGLATKLPSGLARGIDQLLNSASSALFGIGAVLALGARELGGVSLQLIVMSVVLGLLRTAVYESVLFTRDASRTGFAAAMPGVGLSGAAVTGIVMIGIGLLVPQPVETTAATALVGFTTVAVDGVRYGAVIAHREYIALVADAVWLAGSALGIVGLAVSDSYSFNRLALVYALSALVGGTVAYLLLHPIIGKLPRIGLDSLRSQMRFGADFVLQIGPPQLLSAIAPLIIGLSGLGLFRAVATLYQPLNTGMTALRLAVIGGAQAPEQLVRHLRRLTVAAAALSIVYLGGAILFTHVVPILAHGALSDASLALICLFGLSELARTSVQPLFDTARLGNEFRKVMRIRTIQGATLIIASVPLGLWLGTNGYAAARLIVQCLPVLIFGLGISRLRLPASSQTAGAP